MKVDMFITLFNSRVKNIPVPSEESILNVICDLIKPKQYMKYEDKIKIIENTFSVCQNEKYKTPMRYRQLIIDLVNYYTDIELNKDGFDVLSANNLINPILMTFENEYRICESIMSMMADDMLSNINDRM